MYKQLLLITTPLHLSRFLTFNQSRLFIHVCPGEVVGGSHLTSSQKLLAAQDTIAVGVTIPLCTSGKVLVTDKNTSMLDKNEIQVHTYMT